MTDLPQVIARVRQWLADYNGPARNAALTPPIGEFLLSDIQTLVDAIPAEAPKS
jgi:hypothetical protein